MSMRAFLRRGLARHPFLFLLALGFLLLVLWSVSGAGVQEHLAGRIAFGISVLLLRPFALIATWVDPYLQGWPAEIDVGVTSALGLLPYLLLDAGYRRLRPLRRRAGEQLAS